MARIRSIHPGLASDEVYMTMSMAAKAAWTILWTECDDHGVFEWKPIVLKARIFPAESLNFADVLAEYEALGCVMKADVDGKPYGFVRNFCKYQRPKNPSYRHPLPECAKFFVGVSSSPTPALPQPDPQPTEIAALLKEEGGSKAEEGRKEDTASAASSASAPVLDLEDAERRCSEAAGTDGLGSFAPIAELLHRQADLERDVLPVIRSRPAGRNGIKSWRYYVPIITEAIPKAAAATFGPPKVFVARDDPGWDAHCRAAKHSPTLTTQHADTKIMGWYFPTPLNERERSAA